MPLINCPDCKKEVSDVAPVCTNCGRPIAKQNSTNQMGWIVAIIAVIGLVVLSAIFLLTKSSVPESNAQTFTSQNLSQSNSQLTQVQSSNPPISTTTQKASQTTTPSLELVGSSARREYSSIVVEGQVKNIASQPFKNAMAVISGYKADGNFVTSQETFLQYNPILPEQVSTFKAYINNNPAITQYKIEFKESMGGGILSKDSTSSNSPQGFKIID